MEKMASDGPKWGQEDFFPTNPDLAIILGRTDLDFENFYFFHFLGNPDFGIERQKMRKSRKHAQNLASHGLTRA